MSACTYVSTHGTAGLTWSCTAWGLLRSCREAWDCPTSSHPWLGRWCRLQPLLPAPLSPKQMILRREGLRCLHRACPGCVVLRPRAGALSDSLGLRNCSDCPVCDTRRVLCVLRLYQESCNPHVFVLSLQLHQGLSRPLVMPWHRRLVPRGLNARGPVTLPRHAHVVG